MHFKMTRLGAFAALLAALLALTSPTVWAEAAALDGIQQARRALNAQP